MDEPNARELLLTGELRPKAIAVGEGIFPRVARCQHQSRRRSGGHGERQNLVHTITHRHHPAPKGVFGPRRSRRHRRRQRAENLGRVHDHVVRPHLRAHREHRWIESKKRSPALNSLPTRTAVSIAPPCPDCDARPPRFAATSLPARRAGNRHSPERRLHFSGRSLRAEGDPRSFHPPARRSGSSQGKGAGGSGGVPATYTEQQNSRMFVLSIVAAIFLPLSFVTGLFGMNVAGLPGTEDPSAFIYLGFAMSGLTALLLLVFRWQRWL